MKVKQVVGEHKKGVKARIYPKHPKPLIGVEAQKKTQEKRQTDKNKEQSIEEEVPGSEVGTTTSPVKPDGTVDVKKSDGTVVSVKQDELKPGTAPNTLTMPTPKVAPGEKVIAAPVAESADDELLEKMRMIAGLR
jgi:hypothetical protein